jgi:hypothetical protein
VITSGYYDLPKQILREINMRVASHGVKVFVNRSDNNPLWKQTSREMNEWMNEEWLTILLS